MARKVTSWWTENLSNPQGLPEPNRILAVDPGARYNGFAVLDGSDLVYYAIKTINDRRTDGRIFHRGKELLREFIDAYRPEIVAIEKPFIFHPSAERISDLADEMKKEAERTGLRAYQYSPTAIRKQVCGAGNATKSDVAAVVAGLFPELNRYLNPLDEWVEKYNSHIFDAIAVGLMCQHDLGLRALDQPSALAA